MIEVKDQSRDWITFGNTNVCKDEIIMFSHSDNEIFILFKNGESVNYKMYYELFESFRDAFFTKKIQIGEINDK